MKQNPTREIDPQAEVFCRIVRLAPQDQQFTADYALSGDAEKVTLEYYPVGHPELAAVLSQKPDGKTGSFHVTPVRNHCDYQLRVQAEANAEVYPGCWRLIRCGFVPGTVINYIHPEDYTFNSSGRSPASPSLVRLPGGALLASHDIYWGDCGQNLTHVFRSDDNGRSWHFSSQVYPCFWGKLFVHRGRLYLLGDSAEYGDLQLFVSDDEGKNWSEPVVLIPGKGAAAGGPHKAPMPVVEHKGRLWTNIDYGSWMLGGHGSGLISAPADADLMNPDSWSCTGFLRQDDSWTGAPEGKARGTLEGNAVIGKDGEVYDILRYQHDTCTPAFGKAVMLHMDADHPDRMPEFFRILDFPGNLSKFDILFDDRTDRYYSLVNRVLSSNINQRNVLSLMVSDDLLHWELKRDILNYQDNGFPEDSAKVGFQYVSFLFDGEDILFASRTAINNAENYHNANHLTFHRIKNYAR